jgi:hypothetical protein
MHTLLVLTTGSNPSSRRGFSIRALIEDFVQSPVCFFAAVEAEEALEATSFFVFPISTGKLCSELGRKAMAQDEKSSRAGVRKEKEMRWSKCGNSASMG